MKTMRRNTVIALTLGAALLGAPASGQEPHQHDHGAAHGSVQFPVSCKPEVQRPFAEAVAILHSFGYEEARRGFQDVADQDPACGIAWWGVAMSYFHQHWDRPTPAELEAGRAAAETAARLGATTNREEAYIAAIVAFYHDADKLDHRSRSLAYKAAMEKLAADFPEDDEASILYALSLLATRAPDDTTYVNQKKAAQILNRLLPKHPEHPGIVHYTIHAFDYPELAELALPAARVYAKIAPASPHALHMPSHIFTRRGLWEESIASNLDVARTASAQMAQTHPGAVAFEHLHALDYLEYAYLQMGDDLKAKDVVEEVARAQRFDDPNFAAGYALVSVPARYAVERRDWKAAAALTPPEVSLPWGNFVYARGNTYYANALAGARLGDQEQARTALAELVKLQTTLAAAPTRGPYDWAGQVEAMRLASAGWLAYAEGRKQEAVRLLTAAADKEETVGKHPVTPGPILPAREQLGDLLLELGRAREALVAYEAALADSPQRFNSLYGAARAARAAGESKRAADYYGALVELAGSSTTREWALAEARAFLARQ